MIMTFIPVFSTFQKPYSMLEHNLQNPFDLYQFSRPISIHLDRASLVNKEFIIWLSGNDFLRDVAGNLVALVANHSAGFGSSCPLTEN